MPPLVVQTGSVPALLFTLQRVVTDRPVRVLALDSENVRQYLRGMDGLELRYFAGAPEAARVLDEWKDSSDIFYIGGRAFPFIRKQLRRLLPHATALFPERLAGWAGFVEEFQSRRRRDSILLLQTEGAEFIEDYLREAFSRHHFVRPALSMVCHEKEVSSWRNRHPDWQFWTYSSARELAALARTLRRQAFDASVVFFTGSRGVALAKLLSLLCGARQRIAVNEYRQFIEVSAGSLIRFGYQRWRYGVVPKWVDSAETLIVQTAPPERIGAVLQRLKEIKPLGNTRFSLLVREDRVAELNDPALVSRVVTYPVDLRVADYWKMLREVRARRYDSAVVSFTGEPGYTRLKWLPFLSGIRHKLIFNRNNDCFFFTFRRFLHYWRGGSVGHETLILQTAGEDRMRALLRQLAQIHPLGPTRFSLLAHQDLASTLSDPSLISRVIPYQPDSGLAAYWKLLRAVRAHRYEAAVLSFTGEAGYSRLKWIPFLAGIRHKLIFNRNNDCFFFTLRRFVRYWRGGYAGHETLIIQTADAEFTRAALGHLKQDSPIGPTRYSLLARGDDAAALNDPALISEVISYPTKVSGSEYWKMLRKVRAHHYDAAVVNFTRERGHTRMKWLPFLAGIRHKLVFNGNNDCFFFTLGRFLHYWREGTRGRTRVLVVQTWDEERMNLVLHRLREAALFPGPQYTVLAREDKAAFFSERQPWLSEVLTYPLNAGIREYWRTLRMIRKKRFDAVVAVFTEEPSFQKLKWLPFLVGSHHKLIFNRHFDCFFCSPSNFLKYWTRRYVDEARGSGLFAPELLRALSLPALRAIVFPFRFLYLLGYVSWMKVQRAARMRAG